MIFRTGLRLVHLGRNWIELPHLTILIFDACSKEMTPDPELFALCPNLENVQIVDGMGSVVYQPQDVVPCHAAPLLRLDRLYLKGWSVLAFDPASFHSTPKLKTLFMGTTGRVHDGTYFIPPVKDLRGHHREGTTDSRGGGRGGLTPGDALKRQRAHWTWDWQLPQLSTITLTGEFAYRFEFRMLQGCPSLTKLDLDITTDTWQHPRMISASDLFVKPKGGAMGDGRSKWSSAVSILQGKERLIAPSVVSLRMAGEWVIGDSFLDPFLPEMFPRLERWTAKGWKGFSLRRLMGVVRTKKTRQCVTLEVDVVEPSRKERIQLGLFEEGMDVMGMNVLPTRLIIVETKTKYQVLTEVGGAAGRSTACGHDRKERTHIVDAAA